jgi:tRNA-dihydrouridine synthase
MDARASRDSGKANWVHRDQEGLSIPVIGNGDVKCVNDIHAMFSETKCDAIMIAELPLPTRGFSPCETGMKYRMPKFTP